MSAERDELALDIPTWQDLPFGAHEFVKLDANAAHAVASVLFEKGWRKPRVVTTAEELDALPVGSVIRVAETVAVKTAIAEFPDGTTESEWSTADEDDWQVTSAELSDMHATVLHVGGAE